MKIQKAIRYRCETCGTLHQEIDEAEDCCIPETSEVEGFECGECNEFYEDKEEAKECCKG